jgi:hypothetical protein
MHREPMTPLIAALVTEARALAKLLNQTPAAKNTGENRPMTGKRGSRSAKPARASRPR